MTSATPSARSCGGRGILAAGAAAMLRIDGARSSIDLQETQPGIYEGTYVIGAQDRIRLRLEREVDVDGGTAPPLEDRRGATGEIGTDRPVGHLAQRAHEPPDPFGVG